MADNKHMIHLIYVSSATQELGEDELLALLESARVRNTERNVTGMLLYSGGNFFQVLEGLEADVMAVYTAIERDPRHHDIIEILREPIDKRDFPDWSMGFRHLTEEDESQFRGYSDYMSSERSAQEIAESGIAIQLLEQFARNVR